MEVLQQLLGAALTGGGQLAVADLHVVVVVVDVVIAVAFAVAALGILEFVAAAVDVAPFGSGVVEVVAADVVAPAATLFLLQFCRSGCC